MSSILALRDYGGASSGESDDDTPTIDECTAHLKPIEGKSSGVIAIHAAPEVTPKTGLDDRLHINPDTKELMYNPKYDALYAPVLGPKNPFQTKQQQAQRNMLTGHVEEAHVSPFQFETQRRTFTSFGYAIDPSTSSGGTEILSNDMSQLSKNKNNETVFEKTAVRPLDKRKRFKNTDASDIEGFIGPWGGFVDEQHVMKPTEEEQEELDAIVAKRQKRGKQTEDKPMEEKTILHIKDAYDYQGRSYLHIPQDVGINLRSENPPDKCFIPKKELHSWKGHTKGIHAIRWFPQSGHLLLSCSMDNKVKLWEVYNNRRCIRTFLGHRQAVRDVCFDNSGEKFLSAGYDRYIKLWDTETGDCISRFTNKRVAYCVKFHPDEEKQHLFVAGTADKKIICWDTRTEEIVQEYDRHLGPVNTITFIDENRRFVSTSDDKSLRVWEWDIPVDMKYIADPTMHSMPAVALSPNNKWLACQSMDNKIVIFTAINRYKIHRKKQFTGHMVAGYACGLDFSPDMSYLTSGDADGKCYVWDWKTTKLYSKWKAHDGVCIQSIWHPHEPSKVATAGWDGLIKLWD